MPISAYARIVLASVTLSTASSGAAPAYGSATAIAAAAPMLGLEFEGLLNEEPVAFLPIASAARPFVSRGGSSALECLTAAVYFEGRSEPEAGQRAIAQVVLNRVRHPAFPDSVCGVVYQGAARSTGCQFTFTCDGAMRARREPAAWAEARRIAAQALAGRVYEPVQWATHYHRDDVHPSWAPTLRKLTSVGVHRFYVWSGSAGRPHAFTRSALHVATDTGES